MTEPYEHGKIRRNRGRCLLCEDIVESKHRHDCRSCSCGNLMVDGGLEYIRRGYKRGDMIEDLSEFEFGAPETLGDGKGE